MSRFSLSHFDTTELKVPNRDLKLKRSLILKIQLNCFLNCRLNHYHHHHQRVHQVQPYPCGQELQQGAVLHHPSGHQPLLHVHLQPDPEAQPHNLCLLQVTCGAIYQFSGQFAICCRILPGTSIAFIYSALSTKTNRIARILAVKKMITYKYKPSSSDLIQDNLFSSQAQVHDLHCPSSDCLPPDRC